MKGSFGKRKADLLKDEKEAETRSALALKSKEEAKELKKGKKTDKALSGKTKVKSVKKPVDTETPSAEKPVKKTKAKSKE